MTVSRRGLFGVFTVGAVAGPAVVANVLTAKSRPFMAPQWQQVPAYNRIGVGDAQQEINKRWSARIRAAK